MGGGPESPRPRPFPRCAGAFPRGSHSLIFERRERSKRDGVTRMFLDFSFVRQDQATDSLSWHPYPSQPLSSILASQLPPQHHDVKFNLTHKINFPIIPAQKRKSCYQQFHEMGDKYMVKDANIVNPDTMATNDVARGIDAVMVPKFASRRISNKGSILRKETT